MLTTHRHVNQRDARSKIRVWVHLVDKSVLSPISHHQPDAHHSKRQSECEKCGAEIPFQHHHDEHITCQLGCACLDGQTISLFTDKVKRELDPNEGEKSSNIAREMQERVALIPNGGRKIVRAIALAVMVLDVVVKIRIPSVSHEGLQDIRNQMIEKCVLFCQHAVIVNMVVQHKGERSTVPTHHDTVTDGMGIGEVVKEV